MSTPTQKGEDIRVYGQRNSLDVVVVGVIELPDEVGDPVKECAHKNKKAWDPHRACIRCRVNAQGRQNMCSETARCFECVDAPNYIFPMVDDVLDKNLKKRLYREKQKKKKQTAQRRASTSGSSLIDLLSPIPGDTDGADPNLEGSFNDMGSSIWDDSFDADDFEEGAQLNMTNPSEDQTLDQGS